MDNALMGQSTPITAFDTLLLQYRHIEHMHEGVWLGIKILIERHL